jgi:adenylate cyclase
MNNELSAGAILSHYRIVSKIGEGGMGEVYLAQDTKLDRRVALKILPADVASNRDRMERFVREAKSAATLNHPNIAHIYEIGESNGTHYIAMEFIDGETLRDKIHRDKAPLSKLLKYLIQVAQGLSKAHAAGIVHRDLKPDNIMITRDDYAKVLDFGLAKLVEPQRTFGSESGSSEIATAVMQKPGWDSGRSTPGMVLGTIGYMSPEQASGRVDEIDLRSDIFSFGCILFEAATGHRAFAGKDVLDSLHKIVHAPTPQLKDANPLAPAELQRVVRRCLAKEREKRYQSIKELVIELDDLQQELRGFTESEYSGRPTPATSAPTSGMMRVDEGFWVAVLTFKSSGTAAELKALAEGLSEDIVTGLSRFSYLRVIARGSTIPYANQTTDLRTVGKELGARYVMEGTLRQAGKKLRLAVQLVDATTGAHLWAENYEREFSPETIFELQDDLVPRIVSTVADWYGVLPHSMSESVRLRPPDQLSPYEALLRSFGYFENIAPQEHAVVRSSLERAVGQEPGNADCWAMLSMLIGEEHRFGFNVKPDSLGRSLTAARKAVEIAHANHFAWLALAQALFFRKEFDPFRDAAERSIALNPMDGSTVEYLGHLIAFSGDWERGCELAERARQLNPNHPSWYWSVSFLDAYHKGDYLSARPFLLKGNPQKNWLMHALLAAVQGQLGENEAAASHLREVLEMMPNFSSIARDEFSKWYLPELVDHLMDGLRKAGLETAADVQVSKASSSFASSESRAEEGFWIAVLPFKVVGPGTELEMLALGMTQEIVTGFSRFSYLRVMGLGSTRKYSQSGDLGQIGAELGARYVMEGSIRQAGSTVRLTVQLVDTSNGAHLWAETFDRQFQPDQIFAMQDELIPRIVSTCADHFGVLARSISEATRGKDPTQLSPYEALMRGFGYHYRLNPEEHAEARNILEQAVKDAPNNADCWAMLSWVYSHEYGHGFNTQPGSLDRALAAARRAVDLAPTNHLAYQTLAVALFFRKERANCLSAAERAITLNPLDASNEAIFLITFVDDWERGCSLIRRAMDLNPYVPGWYRVILALNEYRKSNYREAVDETVKANAPGIWTDIVLSAAYAQLGEQVAARNALNNLIADNSVESVRELLTKWFYAELVEHLVVGLSKAGLEIAPEDRPADAVNAAHETITVSSFDSRPAIAVLPFVNISNDVDNDYFCDGLAEELLNALSKIESLHVAARTSAFYFKDKQTDIREIGKKLNVSTVLEGSVRKSGSRVRINVQLVNVADGYHLWSEKYDRQLADIFDIQDEISLAIVDALKLKLLGSEQKVVMRYTDNTEAYELFLKGRYYHNKYSPEGWRRAIEFFEKAIEKEPNYAPAYAGMNTSLGFLWFLGFLPAAETVPQMKAAAIKALEIDENLAEAHLSQAMISFFYDWKWQKAEQEFKRAIALDPHNAEAISFYSMFLGFEERFDEAIDQGARALAIDPLSTLINMNVGWTYFSAGLFDKTLEQVGKMIEVEPDFYGCYWLRGAVYLSEGEYETAVNSLKKAVSLGGRQVVLADLGAAYGLAGKDGEATEILNQLLEMRQREYVPAICMARIYSRIGENDKAIDWLEKAFEEKNGEMVFLKGEIYGAAQGDSLNSLGNDPRVIGLLQKMNLP